MAYICSGCSKFASVDAEVDDVQVDDNDAESAELSAEIRLVSQCCSETVAECSVSDSFSFTVEHEPTCVEPEDGYTFEIDVDGFDPTDWYDGKPDKKGKMPPIRYQRHFYGVEGTFTATCQTCDAAGSVEYSMGEAASSFDAY